MGVEPVSKGQNHTPFVHRCKIGASPFLRMWQISVGNKTHTHTHRGPKEKPLQGLTPGAQVGKTLGPGIMRT